MLAKIDTLNRAPFANILASTMDRLRTDSQTGEAPSYAVHIDGAWGTGKSSILNFMEDWLVERKWVVIKFNAWQHEHNPPPWWPLIKSVHDQGVDQLKPFDPMARKSVKRAWYKWRIKTSWISVALVLAGLLVAATATGAVAATGPHRHYR